MARKKICIIGAGPSGMSFLYQWDQRRRSGEDPNFPEVVCFEQQESWGGQWKLNWQTGTDENGKPVHGAMYHSLWSNGPKEGYEFPDFTLNEFFGKPVPAYLPRDATLQYFQARWNKYELKKWIKFQHCVEKVQYDKEKDTFTVEVMDYLDGKRCVNTFDYVVVSSGPFPTPNFPDFPGIDQFPGEVIHSKFVRSFDRFKDKNVYVIGAGFSTEDIAVQLVKFKAKKVVTSYKSLPLGYLPKGVEERPMLKEISGNTIILQDGFEFEADMIIVATGYKYNMMFLEESLRQDGLVTPYIKDAYKSILWLKGGNRKLFYIGMIYHVNVIWMFDLQSCWILKVILGEITLPKTEMEMRKDIDMWIQRRDLSKSQNPKNKIDSFQFLLGYATDYQDDLMKETSYPHDFTNIDEMNKAMEEHRRQNILTYRDQIFTSIFTGTKSTLPIKPFMEMECETLEEFKKIYNAEG